MSTSLIPLTDSGSLPAHIVPYEGGNEFGFSGGGFPTMSIKSKVFTINRGGEKTLVTKPGEDGEPASSIEVVILNVGPKGGKYARTFYAQGYVEGGSSKPDCYSNNGEVPGADAQTPQAKNCALCPHNAAGSGATSQNPKAKACKSSKMLAIAPAGQLNDPMMLRVPGGSTIVLGEYGDYLAKRRVRSSDVVTRIGFDYTVAHPALTFKQIGLVTPEMRAEIEVQKTAPLVLSIIGEKVLAVTDTTEGEEETPTPVVAPQPAKAKVKSAPMATVAAAPAPAEDKLKKAAKAAPVIATADLDKALDALDFDA